MNEQKKTASDVLNTPEFLARLKAEEPEAVEMLLKRITPYVYRLINGKLRSREIAISFEDIKEIPSDSRQIAISPDDAREIASRETAISYEVAKEIASSVLFKVYKGLNKTFDPEKGPFKPWLFKIIRNTVITYISTNHGWEEESYEEKLLKDKALEILSEQDQFILKMEGFLTDKEIAEKEGITETAVRTRRSRANDRKKELIVRLREMKAEKEKPHER